MVFDRIRKRIAELKKISKENKGLKWKDLNKKEKFLVSAILLTEIGMIIVIGIVLIFLLVQLLFIFVLEVFS